jgi:hypothetical protein
MKVVLWVNNDEVGKEHIFKPTVGNESSHKISNYNGVWVEHAVV